MSIKFFQAFLENQKDSLRSFANDASALHEILEDFRSKSSRWQQDEQTLNIGIMGQVKAGKSSFLNALLFNGVPILPQAATPKTANLTKVIYGEKYSLEVEYYSRAEWQEISELAARNGDSAREKVARELFAMAQQHGGAVVNSEGNKTFFAADLQGLQGLLNQYTGNDGRYSALVKSTIVTLPDERLRGLALVDTPGMNDPVQSRSHKTREYMAESDVVFFLSRCSQFFDETDVQLLFQQLPAKGVKRIVVVAGQFDSAIQDDGYDRDSLADTIINIRTRLLRIAGDKMAELRKLQQGANNRRLSELLSQLDHPVFASTFAYGFTHWPEEKWSDSMRHTYEQIMSMAKECWAHPINREEWLKIANFDELTAQYQQARKDREVLLNKQRQGVESETVEQLEQWRYGFSQTIQQRIHLLNILDIQSLEKQEASFRKRIKHIAAELNDVIDKLRWRAREESQEMLMKLESDSAEYLKLQSHTGSREDKEPYEVSDSTWYLPWTWWDTHIEYRTITRRYEFMLAADAIEQVREYGVLCANSLCRHLNQLISPPEIRNELRKKLLSHMDTSSDEFDPIMFKSTLNNVISALKLPELNMTLSDAASIIPESGEIEDQDGMNDLKKMLKKALANILDQLRHSLDRGVNDVMEQMEKLQRTLEDKLTGNIQAEMNAVRISLANKEDEKQSYQKLLKQISGP